MAELARGSVGDRPWGRTLAALGLRAVTGQLTLLSEGKHFLIAFEHGAIVAAASPLASDAAVRVALTSHLISSSQVPEISRRQAATPDRDEIDVIAELARLGPDHAQRLRRRVIAQRAARTFSINHGDFLVADETELAILPGCALDIRAIIYMGARANLSEQRLATELDQLGGWFRLKAAVDDDLPQFGFTDTEQPVVERLRDGGTLAELEDFASTFVDARTVRAVVYALAAYNACDVAPPRRPTSATVPPALAATQPLPKVASPGPIPRAFTQPLPRTPTPPGSEPLARETFARTPPGGEPLARTSTPRGVAIGRATPRTQPPPIGGQTEPMTTFPSDEGAALRAPGVQQTEPMTTFPPDEGAALRARSDDPRDRSPIRRSGSSSEPALRYPADDRPARRPSTGSDPALRAPDDPRDRSTRRSGAGSDPALRAPDGSSPGLRYPDPRAASDPALRPPDRRDDSRPPSRYPAEPLAGGAPPPGATTERDLAALGYPSDDGSAAIPPPRVPPRGATTERDVSALSFPAGPGTAAIPPPRAEDRPDAGAVVVRRVASARPPPTRQVSRSDSPMSHNVKALIAQRLKLLDQGADHFQLLGIGQTAAPDAVRKAYFALARQLHPDRLAALGISDDGKHAQRLFAEINAGFAILSDPERRAGYLSILRRGGEAAIRAEQAKAEDLARRILEAEEAYHRGELALRRDQPAAAVADLERAIQLNPDEADYHATLAWAQFCAAADRPAVAAATRANLERAIQRSPKAPTARFFLGRVERMLGRDADAARHFRDVLEASPHHAEAAAELRVLESRLADKPSGGGLFGRKR